MVLSRQITSPHELAFQFYAYFTLRKHTYNSTDSEMRCSNYSYHVFTRSSQSIMEELEFFFLLPFFFSSVLMKCES